MTEIMDGTPVKLYVYELSNGLARQMSPLLLGKQIDGIWHTGVVCFGKEFFFGGGGIEYCLPGRTILGEPNDIIELGNTQIPENIFTEFLKGLAAESFRADKYHLFDHNCNTFSNELTFFLTGKKIPKRIRNLSHEVINSSFGQMIKPMIDSMTVTPAGGSSVGAGPTQGRPRTKQDTNPNPRNPLAESSGLQDPESIFEPRESSHSARSTPLTADVRVPAPLLFQANDVKQDIKVIKEAFIGSKNERRVTAVLNQLENLVLKGKKVTLSDDHLSCLENIFQKLLEKDTKLNVLELLKALTLEKTFLNHPKVSNVLYCVISDLLLCVSKQDYRTTVAALHILCNSVSSKVGHDVLLNNNTQPSVTSVITSCLLQEDQKSVEIATSELALNVARYKVRDEVAFECSTALLEVINRNLDTDIIYNCLFAIQQFMKYSTEVSGLAQALGVNFDRYLGKSDDIDQLCCDLKTVIQQPSL